MIGLGPLEYLKLAVTYGSYLYFPLAGLLLWVMATRSPRSRVIAGALLAVATLGAYARFVEPHKLIVRSHAVALEKCHAAAGAARLAVFADTHNGLFPNTVPLARIARAVAAAEPDLVLVAGDFTYFLAPRHFRETYKAFAAMGAPVYAVLGNHDIGRPGPDVAAPLTLMLSQTGVHMTDNQRLALETRRGALDLVGLADLWGGGQATSLLEGARTRPLIALTHNPSSVLEFRRSETFDLLVAGHTHGGQVYIPGLTCALMPDMCAVTLAGFEATDHGLVFVTTGTGMVGLPMRFNRPPQIDVIDLSWRACGA